MDVTIIRMLNKLNDFKHKFFLSQQGRIVHAGEYQLVVNENELSGNKECGLAFSVFINNREHQICLFVNCQDIFFLDNDLAKPFKTIEEFFELVGE